MSWSDWDYLAGPIAAVARKARARAIEIESADGFPEAPSENLTWILDLEDELLAKCARLSFDGKWEEYTEACKELVRTLRSAPAGTFLPHEVEIMAIDLEIGMMKELQNHNPEASPALL